MKIAIIGSGISGLAAAWLFNAKHDITVFEKKSSLGGHTHTQTIDYRGKIIDVDTGFIVFNRKNYPNLCALFSALNVRTEKSDMSFGVNDLSANLQYSGNNISGVFAQPQNLFKVRFLKMLFDIIKFNKKGRAYIEQQDQKKQQSLAEFLFEIGVGETFKKSYLLPMAGAIWSSPIEQIERYPAASFLRFFYNHGLLTITDQPQWFTVSGGAKEYVAKITEPFKNNIRLQSEVISVNNAGNKPKVLTRETQEEFDHVIFANHAPEIVDLIEHKSDRQGALLQQFSRTKNKAVLHCDEKQMPKIKKAWSSWVYTASTDHKELSVTYWMNNLQNIPKQYPLFVTLNPVQPIQQDTIFSEHTYYHPVFDHDTITAQNRLETIQGNDNLWYCGAWTGYGFHEDGLVSAINIAKKFSIQPPWKR